VVVIVSPMPIGREEPETLRQIDRARARKFRAEDGGDQAAAPHAVRDNAMEQIRLRVDGIKVRRIDVAGDNGESSISAAVNVRTMLALSPAAISSNVRFSIVAVFDATMLSTRGILLAWMESDAQGVCAGHPESRTFTSGPAPPCTVVRRIVEARHIPASWSDQAMTL